MSKSERDPEDHIPPKIQCERLVAREEIAIGGVGRIVDREFDRGLPDIADPTYELWGAVGLHKLKYACGLTP